MFGRHSRRKASSGKQNQAKQRHLQLESLEDRLTPTTLPISLLEHIAQLTAELGITPLTAKPSPVRDVSGSVFLTNHDMGWDSVVIDAPASDSLDPDLDPAADGSEEIPEDIDTDPTDSDLPTDPLEDPAPDNIDDTPTTVTDPAPGTGLPLPGTPTLPGSGLADGGIIDPMAPGLPDLGGVINPPAQNPPPANQPADPNNPGAGGLPGAGANPGAGAANPANPGGGALPGGNVNPGNITPGAGTTPGAGYFPISGTNPINPGTGSPYWPNPGPMPGAGIIPGNDGTLPTDGSTTPTTGDPGAGTTTPPGGTGSPSGALRVAGIDPDTGVSSSDRITKAKTPSVFGSAPANSVVSILYQGTLIGRGTADASGKFRVAITSALPDGEHMLQIACSQAATMPLQVTIDTTAPTPTIQATRWVPERTNLEVKLGLASAADTSITIALDVDLNQNGAFEPNELAYRTGIAGDTFIIDDLKGYGDYTLRARAEDVAGNVGSASALSFVDKNAGFVGDTYLRELAQPAYAALGYTGTWDGRALAINNDWVPSDPALLKPITVSARTGLVGDFAQFKSAIENLGMTNIAANPADGLVEGYIPLYKVLALPNTPAFSSAAIILRETHVGSVQNQGVPVMRVPQFMQETGYTGLGMKVGVLSDSINANGSLTNAIASGDLPANVQVLYDDPTGNDEGCAMAEIIYDVGPGFNLAFNSAGPGPQGFADGIRALSAAGCNSIVDDVTYFTSPIYNEGRINLAINDVVFNDGRFYSSSAGNSGDSGYRGSWTSINSTVGGVSGTFMNFGGVPYQEVHMSTNAAVRFAIKWDQAYLEGGSILPNFQVQNTVYAYLIDLSTDTVVDSSTMDNPNTDMAFQFLAYQNTGSNTRFGLAFQLVGGVTPTALAWTSYGDNTGADSLFPNGTGGSSLSMSALAKGAVAVAAVDWRTPTVPEDFTSKGGVLDFLFDADGNRLATPYTFFKPQLTAPDGVSTSVQGFDPFYGTSAAAPQVAAVAALVWGNQPSLTRDQVLFHLYATAIDISPVGQDDITGMGLVQAYPIPSDAFGAGDISNNSLTAYDLGYIGSSPVISPYLDISNQAGLPDYDWFTVRASQAGKLNLRMLQGSTGSLEVRFFTLDKNMSLVQRAASTTPNLMLRNVSLNVAANELVYIEVKGRNSSYGVMDEAFYQMTLKVS